MMPVEQAFLCRMLMSKTALAIPVSSWTCEGVFSKMNLIKRHIPKNMADERLSDLCILSIEGDFEMNFEEVVDEFAISDRNSRILLR